MGPDATVPAAPTATLGRARTLLLAVAAGVALANNYYAQPLLPEIGKTFHLSSDAAGLTVTLGQIGYAFGLLLIMPLGDIMERRRFVVTMSLCLAGALALLAGSPSAAVLLPAALLVGSFSVLAQLLTLTGAALAGENERGRVVGTISAGLSLGILLARTVSGYLTEVGGWRLTFWLAAGFMVLVAAVLGRLLPHSRPGVRASYPALLRTTVRLLRNEPVLRLRVAHGMTAFSCFSMLWTTVAFLLAGPAYGYSPGTIGLFGLIAAVSAAGAAGAGRLADRGLAPGATGLGAALVFGSWLPLWLGHNSVIALIVGIVMVDFGVQYLAVLNYSELYRLRPEVRGRLNAAYMTCTFSAGGLASAVAAVLWTHFGWTAVCLAGALLGGTTFTVWVVTRHSPRLHAGRVVADPPPEAAPGS